MGLTIDDNAFLQMFNHSDFLKMEIHNQYVLHAKYVNVVLPIEVFPTLERSDLAAMLVELLNQLPVHVQVRIQCLCRNKLALPLLERLTPQEFYELRAVMETGIAHPSLPPALG